MTLIKVFTPSEIEEMNRELKTEMENNKVLISVFGLESVKIHFADKIYKSHGGN